MENRIPDYTDEDFNRATKDPNQPINCPNNTPGCQSPEGSHEVIVTNGTATFVCPHLALEADVQEAIQVAQADPVVVAVKKLIASKMIIRDGQWESTGFLNVEDVLDLVYAVRQVEPDYLAEIDLPTYEYYHGEAIAVDWDDEEDLPGHDVGDEAEFPW